MRVGVGYSDIPESGMAGRQAAQKAIKMSGRADACDVALLFCTARHDQQILRDSIVDTIGQKARIYGGGAVGIITNDEYGYAGDQVGVACIWLDDTSCNIFTENGLNKGEKDVGHRLGRHLSRVGVTRDSSVLMLYDAIKREDNSSFTMMMATWILEGIEDTLGFLPDLNGAGLMADFSLSSTAQFTGKGISKYNATTITFGDDIHIDSVVMHGCRPASIYYTVTKADGPVILEINNQPAIQFIDELFEHVILPEQYPFFLLFGVNSGERWGEFDEDNYASRLCLDIDRERNGIVMFEPDMVEGTEFQIMIRSMSLDYIKPKMETLFANLNGRKPIFAVYINCTGRAAGYNGIDVEDALAIQEALADRAPLLGFYTGVEISEIGGKARGLDLTGVFCLFSQEDKDYNKACDKDAEDECDAQANPNVAKANTTSTTVVGADAATPSIELTSPDAHTSTSNAAATISSTGATISGTNVPAIIPVANIPNTDVPLEFVTKLAAQNAAKIMALDAQSVALRYELELKRRGFKLLSELAVSLRKIDVYEDVFSHVASRINAALNMQKTIVLLMDGKDTFSPVVMQGFAEADKNRLMAQSVHIPDAQTSIVSGIINIDSPMSNLAKFSKEFDLPYFLAAPISVHGETVGVLLTGRMVVEPPYLTPLGDFDLETVNAIAELLGAVLVRRRLREVTIKAEIDGLTGLNNRSTFKRLVEDYMADATGAENCGVFMMIDIDFFKNINDSFGHIVGDHLLKDCAKSMQGTLRTTDIIGRQGGDEFVVFCPGISDVKIAKKRAAQINQAWKEIAIEDSHDINHSEDDAKSNSRISASIGIAMYPQHGICFEELYNNADIALYAAKENGRDGYVLFESNDDGSQNEK